MRYLSSMNTLSFLLIISACSVNKTPEYCTARAGDMDCDGVEDAVDMCQGTAFGLLTDATGCSSEQLAKCSIELVSPSSSRSEQISKSKEITFRWDGTCDLYHLQFSNDATFPPAATRTRVRTRDNEATTIVAEDYWRVWGGMEGNSHGAHTPARELSW